MHNEWTHKFVARRAQPTIGPRAYIEVTAGLYQISSQRPYFSVTAEVWRHPNAADIESGGCLHDEVLKLWPRLKPIVDLHLSEDNGVPMHATANSWYQLAGFYGGFDYQYHAGNSKRQIWTADGAFVAYREPTPDECLASFADYVRIPLEDARTLADGWLAAATAERDVLPPKFRVKSADIGSRVKGLHVKWVNEQLPRWQAEATAGIELLDTLIAEQKAKTA